MKKGMETESEKEMRAPLSLSEFRKLQNNFWMHFADGFWGDSFRKNSYFRKFAKDYPELNAQLREKTREVSNCVKGREKPSENSPYRDFFGLGWDSIAKADTPLPIYEEMYEAYKIMRTYVEKDEDMGIQSRSELKKEDLKI